jgi:hypothetical protein
MSNLTDLLDALGYEGEKATNIAGAAVGTVADFGGALSGVAGVVSMIQGLFSQDDSVQQILASIQNTFLQLQGQLAASDKLQKMRDIDSGITPQSAFSNSCQPCLPPTPRSPRISS